MRAIRNAVLSILTVALLTVLPNAANAQTPEKRKVNIATASLGLPYLPLIIAQQRKYFAEEGLEVEIAAFAGGSKALQSLMGGSSDVASGAYSNTLTMAAKGQKLTYFVTQVRYPALGIAVSPLADYLERLLDFATRSRWGKRPIARADATAIPRPA